MNEIDRYLTLLDAELTRRGLRSARLVEEAGAHLNEAAGRLTAEGLPAAEAQRRAVERFGEPETVARSHADSERNGGARTSRRRAVAGFALVLPAVLFLAANLLRYNLGAPALYQTLAPVLDNSSPALRAGVDVTVLLGPVIALISSALLIFNIDLRRGERAIVGSVAVRISPAHLAVVAASLVILAIITAYVIGENLPCIAGAQEYC